MKAKRWQISFVSRLGVKYRLYIYDEGYTGSIVELSGGPQPFVTDENDSEDIYEGVRSQTGTIQVVTKLPDGGRITLDDLLPADNLSRPVRLMAVDGEGNETVKWQGFLSCEAYSQTYTEIPEVLDIPVISVLEAMDSVEVELDEDTAFLRIIGHVGVAMKAIEDKCGMSLFQNVYVSGYILAAIIVKYMYNNVYFTSEEVVNEDNVTVEVHSVSCREILERIAKFFGGCWRERSRNLYLLLPDDGGNIRWLSFTRLYENYVVNNTPAVWRIESRPYGELSDEHWTGTNHQRNVVQGARRVIVSSSLDDFECEISLPEVPVGSLVENPSGRQSAWGEVYCNVNEAFYSLAMHRHMKAKTIFPTDLSPAHLDFVESLDSISYEHTIFWAANDFRTHYEQLVNEQSQGSNTGIDYWLTSYTAYWRDDDDVLRSGLMLCGAPKYLWWSYNPAQGRAWRKFALTADNWVYRQSSPLIFAAGSGYLKINIHTLRWWGADHLSRMVYGALVYPTLTIALKFGDKWAYLDGSDYAWSDTFHTIEYPLEHETTNGELGPESNWNESMGIDESEGLFIKIPSYMVGFVSVYLYHEVNALCADPFTNAMFDVLIDQLDIDYLPLEKELQTSRSENRYMSDTGMNFRDEISVNLNIASFANNNLLATMIWDNAQSPAKLVSLGARSVRPEKDLLRRMKNYYSAVRQRLDLLVTPHNDFSPSLPEIMLNGIGDGKVYAPLAESRNWREDTSTMICFETGLEPSET